MNSQNRTVAIFAAFAVVYVVWGSTYLAIRMVVHGLPPALAAGSRFVIAGLIMLAIARLRGIAVPRGWNGWRTTVITAVLMLVGGNGLVTWSEQWVPSNQAALIVATAALWIAGLGTLGPKGQKLGTTSIAGLVVGFVGVAVLVGEGLSHTGTSLPAYAALLFSPICWAAGSVYGMRYPATCGPLMNSALQMLVAGVILSVIGLAMGETQRWTWDADALWALLYLIIAGSCIAYGAYVYLVGEVSPAQLATYAYVNPAIAVLIGWWLADEQLSRMQWLGTLIILAGVALAVMPKRPKATSAAA
jgi:drug/metabolite transporter (DMT)-like permease